MKEELPLETSFIGNNGKIEKISYHDSRVYVNRNCFFDNVNEEEWNFTIGGYQPAQRWLKERKGRILTDKDVLWYQRMIAAIRETALIMNQIDLVIKI